MKNYPLFSLVDASVAFLIIYFDVQLVNSLEKKFLNQNKQTNKNVIKLVLLSVCFIQYFSNLHIHVNCRLLVKDFIEDIFVHLLF